MEKKVENQTNKENKVIGTLVLIIILVVCIVAAVLYINTKKDTIVKTEDVKDIIKEGKTAIIYVENSDSKKCGNCSEIKKYLDSKNINYVLYDVKKNSKDNYKEMLQNLTINPKDFGYPGVIYVKDGEIYSDIINIKDTKTVEKFIKEYDLTKIK